MRGYWSGSTLSRQRYPASVSLARGFAAVYFARVSKQRFIIAPRREARRRVGSDWQSLLKSVPGVRIVAGNERRAQVEVEDNALNLLQDRLGVDFAIEPLILHTTH